MLLGAVRLGRSGSGPPSPLRCVARAVAQRVQCAECLAAAGMLGEQGSVPADIYVSIADVVTHCRACPRSFVRVAQNR